MKGTTSILRLFSALMAAVLCTAAIFGCSGKETVQTSSEYQKLPPDVAKQHLDAIMKHRGMNVKDDKKYMPGGN